MFSIYCFECSCQMQKQATQILDLKNLLTHFISLVLVSLQKLFVFTRLKVVTLVFPVITKKVVSLHGASNPECLLQKRSDYNLFKEKSGIPNKVVHYKHHESPRPCICLF